MKRGVRIAVILCLVLILSMGFVAAGWWSDFWSRILGVKIQLSPGAGEYVTYISPSVDGIVEWRTSQPGSHFEMINDGDIPDTLTYIEGFSGKDIVISTLTNVQSVSQVVISSYGNDQMGGASVSISKDGVNWELDQSLNFGASTAWDAKTFNVNWNVNGDLSLYTKYSFLGGRSVMIFSSDAGVVYTPIPGGRIYSSLIVESNKSGLIVQQEPNNYFGGRYPNGYYLGGTSYDYRHYEYFDLSSIPSNAEINRAVLSKYNAGGSGLVNIQVKRAIENWQESQSYNPLGRYPNTAVSSVNKAGTGDLVFDVRALVQEMMVEVNEGFEFSKYNNVYSSKYFYFRNANNVEKRPKLKVVYFFTLCGNGNIDPGEDCDGVNLDGKSCADLPEFDFGTLACDANCRFDTSGCGFNVACYNDAECDDQNSRTVDICHNPGTRESYCTNEPIACFQNSDCGLDGFIGSKYCRDADVYQDYRTWSCVNPGTAQANCNETITPQIIEDCIQACENAECVECVNGDYKYCPLQQGVCAGSQETCTNNVWPGCFASNYSNYGPNYEEVEASCEDRLDNDCDGKADNSDSDCLAMGCNGCMLNDVCVPFGFRTSSQYCDLNKNFASQKQVDGACYNNWECLSNTCSDGKCVGLVEEVREQAGLLWRILCTVLHPISKENRCVCITGDDTKTSPEYLACMAG